MLFTRSLVPTEEELVKIRKQKQKGIIPADLTPMTLKAFIDLSGFEEPGSTELV